MATSVSASSTPIASHSHGGGALSLPPSARRRVRLILAALVVPLAVLTLIGIIYCWPNQEIIQQPLVAEGSTLVTGEVTHIGATDKYGQTPVEMRTAGKKVALSVPLEIVENGLAVGDKVRAIYTPNTADYLPLNSTNQSEAAKADLPPEEADDTSAAGSYVFADFVRGVPMLLLILLYLLVVAVVARGKGLAAMLGLFVSLGVVVLFMMPALLSGENAVLVVVLSAGAMMFASIYLAHGVSIRTTTAILGTFAGLIITGFTAWLTIGQAKLTGTFSHESLLISGMVPGISMQQILLAGMLLAGLGALNDVTITQVSTVWELHAANPHATRASLIRQGMTVGRDHIASTVYTLAFAYVGTALPLLMAASFIDRGFIDFLLVGEISEEIVRTLVASIGLVLAIPLTTVISAFLAPVAPAQPPAVPPSAAQNEASLAAEQPNVPLARPQSSPQLPLSIKLHAEK